MLNTDIKVNLKDTPKAIHDYGLATVKAPAPDKNDAKLELTAACAEYVNAVAPGKKFDVKDLGNAVADFINDRLCLNPDNTPNCVSLAKSWEDMWDELDKIFWDVKSDGKWHNTKHVDEPGLKIDEWVKKNIG